MSRKLTELKNELTKIENQIDILEGNREIWGEAQERERYQLGLYYRKLQVAIARLENA